MIIKKTITTIFMVPTLKIDRNKLIDNEFINAYSNDMDKEIDYQDSIFLLFKPSNLILFKEFLENEYERTKDIIEDYDYDGGYVVVVYKLNNKFKKDFDLIRKSKYSQTSLEFQEQFPKKVRLPSATVHLEKDTDSIQFLIFKKDKKLIDFWEDIIDTDKLSYLNLEVWPCYDDEKEVLNIKKLHKNEHKASIERKS